MSSCCLKVWTLTRIGLELEWRSPAEFVCALCCGHLFESDYILLFGRRATSTCALCSHLWNLKQLDTTTRTFGPRRAPQMVAPSFRLAANMKPKQHVATLCLAVATQFTCVLFGHLQSIVVFESATKRAGALWFVICDKRKSRTVDGYCCLSMHGCSRANTNPTKPAMQAKKYQLILAHKIPTLTSQDFDLHFYNFFL